jgi:hypothetical protein
MKYIKIHPEYGIVVSKRALTAKKIEIGTVLSIFEVAEPLDQNEQLLSFGPHFGEDAANSFIEELESLGLEYVDEFFMFIAIVPNWCEFGVSIQESDSINST